MSLLADLMVRGYCEVNPQESQPMHKMGHEPVAINCEQIAHGFYMETAQRGYFQLTEGLYSRLVDLPTRPPFPVTWLEWQLPLDMRYAAEKELGSYRSIKDGVMLVDKGDWFSVSYFCESPIGGAPDLIGVCEMGSSGGAFPERFRNGWLTPLGGRLAEGMFNDPQWTAISASEWESWNEATKTARYMSAVGMLYIMDVSLRMLHVKNVELADVPPKRRKKQRRPRPDDEIRWTTVRVRPQGKQYSNTQASGLPTLTAHHVVRGHFANYTAEKPLFGKYVGTFWREAHTRGDKAAGEVAKDYEVSPPAEEAA